MRKSFTVALALAAVLAGCAKKSNAPEGPPPPAVSEAPTAASVAMWRTQFETQKQQWEGVMLGPDSPLPEEKRGTFPGLVFYPFDPKWRFVGDLERLADAHIVQVPDNRGKTQANLEYGRYRFLVGGDTAAVTVYRPLEHPEQFFIPFADSTSGNETYGGGRFVHLDSLDAHRFVLDFNKAYLPYCAFDSSWICPLPPAQNRLTYAVRAGMMKPAGAGTAH